MNWSEKRARLLDRLKETEMNLRPPRRAQFSIPEKRKLLRKLDRLTAEYAENVPHVPVSRCPICGEPLELAIDTVGLDGPWWWVDCPEDFAPPRGCEHFQVFLGALDLHGREPHEVDVWGVMPGPGAPFVIARMLSMDGMKAAVGTVPIGANDTGYLVTYFSSEPVAPTDLHQEWRRKTWVLYDAAGQAVGRELKNDPWDFELGPWLEQGKLLWIEAGDGSMKLREGRPCPYENLPGTRQNQILAEGKVTLTASPEGSDPEYYAPY